MAHHTPPASASQALLSPRLAEHRVLVFDVYGTLVDWESAIHDAIACAFPGLARGQVLASYAAVEANLQTQFPRMPYSQILELAHRQLTSEQRASNVAVGREASSTVPDDEAKRFGRSIPQWKPFPDTIEALHRLKKHFALVVLSNVDDDSFAGTHATLCTHAYPGSVYPTVACDSPFSLILTAAQVGAYKPDPLMLECTLRQLSAHPVPSLPSYPLVRADPSAILVVANSIRHDIIPAMHHALRSVWISRHGANVIGNEDGVDAHDPEGISVQGRHPYAWRYETLSSFADAVEEEIRSRDSGARF